jgi:23S rRNA (cytidine2498-2'-O)-methyltransferase
MQGRLYQPVPEYEDHLFAELQDRLSRVGPSLLFASGGGASGDTAAAAFWHQNCWLKPFRLEFDSINEAAGVLRGIQRNWASCPFTQFRRAALIESKLPPLGAKTRRVKTHRVKLREFPWLVGDSPLGAWTLLDRNTMIASALCSSPFPNGIIEFAQDRENPPSRAYLKLWEALVRMRRWPAKGDRCLDAGASPGGWTWALARLGADVLAVDRAPLDPGIAALPGVEYVRHDAFTLKPEDTGPVDWLFCDVACYPPRLYQWIEKWLASGLCENFVCTIKMQGGTDGLDFETPRRFAAIPGGEVVHLYHNKHELTWMRGGLPREGKSAGI